MKNKTQIQTTVRCLIVIESFEEITKKINEQVSINSKFITVVEKILRYSNEKQKHIPIVRRVRINSNHIVDYFEI